MILVPIHARRGGITEGARRDVAVAILGFQGSKLVGDVAPIV